MDAKDTVCQVAMLSIRSEDMLAYYTADQFATGFKKRPAFQLRGITWNSGSSCEGIWITKRQPGSSCPSPDVMAFVGSKDMLCRVAILNIGWEDTLAQFTIEESATGFKKSLAFQPDGIKQSKVPSCEGIWITKRQPGSSCPSPDVMAFVGSKDMLCRVAILNIGWEDTLAQFTIEESATGFKKSLAFQPDGIKQSKVPSGEGIWTTNRQPGSSYTSPDVLVLMGSKDTLCKVVMLSIGVEDTLAHITMAAGFKKMLAFQPCGIKPSRGSSGEGIWITTRFASPWSLWLASCWLSS